MLNIFQVILLELKRLVDSLIKLIDRSLMIIVKAICHCFYSKVQLGFQMPVGQTKQFKHVNLGC